MFSILFLLKFGPWVLNNKNQLKGFKIGYR